MDYQRCLVQLIFVFGIAGAKSQDTEALTDATSTGVTEALEQSLSSSPLEKDAELFINLERKVANGVVLDIKWDAPHDITPMYNFSIICKDNETGYQREYKDAAPSRHVALSLYKPLTTFECSITTLKSDESGVPVVGPSTTFSVSTGEILPPTNVTLLQRTSTSLTYSWSADTTPSTWKVSANLIGDGECGIDDTNDHGESQEKMVVYNFTDLTPGSEYNVSIRNCHDVFCSKPTFVIGATDLPGPVTGLKQKIVNGTVLDVSWDAPDGCKDFDGYTVKCRGLSTGQEASKNVDSETQVLLPLLKPKETFECSIQPFVLNSADQRINATTLDFQVSTEGLFPPKDVKLVERTDTSLTFSWSMDSDAPTWKLRVTPITPLGDKHGDIQFDGESEGGMVVHNVTNLAPWTKYNVSVLNCDESYCSDPFVMIGATDVAAPSNARNLSCIIENDVTALFTWDKPAEPNGPIEGYSLRVYNQDREETKLFSVPGNATSTTLNLSNEFNQFVASLKAYNVVERSGETVYGPETAVQFKTLGKGPAPPRPKVKEVTNHGVQLYWEWPQDPRYHITHFIVKVDGQRTLSTVERQVAIDNLDAWAQYEIRVAACVNETTCGQEGTVQFHTDFGAPSEPLNLTVESAGTHWVLARWEVPHVLDGPLSGYNVSFSDGITYFEVTTVELSYNYTEAIPGAIYNVSVYAFNEVNGVIKRGPTASQLTFKEDDPLNTAGLSTTRPLLASLAAITLVLVVVAVILHKKCPVTRHARIEKNVRMEEKRRRLYMDQLRD
ncbi:fibronectin-like [Dermacentor silvarum]|uniref:fibronectin-like n=1 Tax=Dermacentor silvarum TaxID=543639 RepID=UPI0018976EC2|nr:fibronectin-like [Dermacentor silvarum]